MRKITLVTLLMVLAPAVQADPALVGRLSTGPIVGAPIYQLDRTDGQLHADAPDWMGWTVGGRWIKADGGTEILGTDLAGLVKVDTDRQVSVALAAALSLGGNFKLLVGYEAFADDGTGWATGYSDKYNLIYGLAISVPINGGALFS